MPPRLGLLGQCLSGGYRLALLDSEVLGLGYAHATAFAAITYISGPPCWLGKDGAVCLLGILFSARDHCAARATSVLCTVVVTKSAYSTGLGCKAGSHKPGEK